MEMDEVQKQKLYRESIYKTLLKSTKDCIFSELRLKNVFDWKTLFKAARTELTARTQSLSDAILSAYLAPYSGRSIESLISHQLDISVLQAIMFGADAMCFSEHKATSRRDREKKERCEQAWAIGTVVLQFGTIAREMNRMDDIEPSQHASTPLPDLAAITDSLANVQLFSFVDDRVRQYLQEVPPRAFMSCVKQHWGKIAPQNELLLENLYTAVRNDSDLARSHRIETKLH